MSLDWKKPLDSRSPVRYRCPRMVPAPEYPLVRGSIGSGGLLCGQDIPEPPPYYRGIYTTL
jgi:hypothetical protein